MIGDVLREFRKKAGFTQEQLAHAAGVHRTYISLLERNEKSPTLKVFFAIARALDLRPSTILLHVEHTIADDVSWWDDDDFDEPAE